MKPTSKNTLWRTLEVASSWLMLLGGVVVFGFIATWVHQRAEIPFDEPILASLRALRTTALTWVMIVITHLGSAATLLLVAALGGAGLWARRHRHSAAFLMITAAGAGLLNHTLKALFERPRPSWPVEVASGFSFPSGHAMGSAAVYGAVAMIVITRFPHLRRVMVAACVTLVVAIGISRMYLGVHYPSDVLAGWGLGLSWPLLFKRFVLGPGFRPGTIPSDALRADGIPPAPPEPET